MVLLVGLLACGRPLSLYEKIEVYKEIPTLLIINHGLSSIRVYADNGRYILAAVPPGSSRCVVLPYANKNYTLSVHVSAEGDYETPELFVERTGLGNSWTWLIETNNMRYEVLNIKPDTKHKCIP